MHSSRSASGRLVYFMISVLALIRCVRERSQFKRCLLMYLLTSFLGRPFGANEVVQIACLLRLTCLRRDSWVLNGATRPQLQGQDFLALFVIFKLITDKI
jgi:hypothetical protein